MPQQVPDGSAPPPVCPRHPDRVSYVRCQRCGRPTCPECQVPAAVGVHCVDCVREANASVAPTRTALGGTVRGERPYVTITLIALCVLAFVAQQASPVFTARFVQFPSLGVHEPYRLITAAFLHGGIFHIGFNMYLLWMVGPFLEPMLGRARFIALYLLTALGGSVGVLLLAPATVSYVYGASGAVFGLFGALLVIMYRLQQDVRQILVFFAINGVLGFVLPGISWQGHLGGLLTGLALGAAFAYAPRDRRAVVSWSAIAAVAAVLAALAVGA